MIHVDRPRLEISHLQISVLLLLLNGLAGVGTCIGIPVTNQLSTSQIIHDNGHAYMTSVRYLWPLVSDSDTLDAPNESLTEVFEDGRLLGPAHQLHAIIRKEGHGKYSHWGNELYFSASDNGDPRTNDRQYSTRLRLYLASSLSITLGLSSLFLIGVAIYSYLRNIVVWRLIGLNSFQLVLSMAIAFISGWLTGQIHGVAFWLTLCGAVIAMLWVLCGLLKIMQEFFGIKTVGLQVREMTLAVMSIGLTLIVAEAVLAWHEKSSASEEPIVTRVSSLERDRSQFAELLSTHSIPIPSEVLAQVVRRQSLTTMPQEWELQLVKAEGAVRASLWHGVLHVYDAYGMRRTSEFPLKRKDVFRIVVVGDSLTYGYGIEERYTYSAVLQRLMDNDYSIEFLNLASNGLQSEDIKNRIDEFLPRLQPNLVIYGVCHNDFLPAGVEQYSVVNDAFSVPIPEHVKQTLATRSRVIRLIGDGYNELLLKLGLRADFYDDILKDFRSYQARFAQDIEAMNSFVMSQGLPPVVAMVLDQVPVKDPRGYMITKAAEGYLKQGGMTVIDTEPYYRRFSHEDLRVSRWEGHPNEVANAIWAKMIETHLRSRPELNPFEKLRQ